MQHTALWMTGTVAIAIAAVAAAAAQQRIGPVVPKPLWHVSGEARSGPAADSSHAYFVTKQHDVVAVDVNTGDVRWRRPTGERGETYLLAHVAIAGDVLVVGDYDLVGLSRDTGEELWRFVPSDGHAPGLYLGSTTDQDVLTGSPAGRVYSVAAKTGKPRWSTLVSDFHGTTVYEPSLHGGTVIAGYTEFSMPIRGGVVALAADSGRILWKRAFPPPNRPELPNNFGGGPVIAGDVVLAANGNGLIHAFALDSGEPKWVIPRAKAPPGSLIAPEWDHRGLTVAGDTLVSGSLTGVITGYDLANHAERWRFIDPFQVSTASGITSANGVAYVPYYGGVIVALDVRTGTELWRTGDWKMGLVWKPAFSGQRIILSGSGYGLFAVPDVLPK